MALRLSKLPSEKFDEQVKQLNKPKGRILVNGEEVSLEVLRSIIEVRLGGITTYTS